MWEDSNVGGREHEPRMRIPFEATGGALVLVAALLLGPRGPAQAASFDCTAPGLSAAEQMICSDAQLSQADEAIARRVNGLGQRIGLGSYLSLRYWQYRMAEERINCGSDRVCISASYRGQVRIIERLNQCLEKSTRRRLCLRTTLSGENVSVQGVPGK